MADGLHVVFGAGPLGLAVMRALEARKQRARLVSRSGKPSSDRATPFEWIKGDATDFESARRACAGATVVYHCAGAPYPRWTELLPRMMDGIAAGARVAEAKLIYGDNLYLYGRTSGPMKEDLPSSPNTRKGTIRAQLADRLLEAHHKGALRAAIGRGSDFFGPGVLQSHAGDRLFPQALAGKPAAVLGDPDKLHTFTYIADFGKALVTLGERDEALGKAWHVPNSPTLTRRAFIERIYSMAGNAPAMRLVRRWQLSMVAPFNPMLREVKEMLYQLEEDFVVDSSRFTATFGMKATPLDEALRATLDWYALKSATEQHETKA